MGKLNIISSVILFIPFIISCTYSKNEYVGSFINIVGNNSELTSDMTVDGVSNIGAASISGNVSQGNSEVCIPPLASFSMPIIQLDIDECTNGKCGKTESEVILPGTPWKIVSEVPFDVHQGLENEWRQVRIAGIKGKEIWVFERYKQDIMNQNYNYYIFNTQTSEWKKVKNDFTFEGSQRIDYYISELLITENGNVWGVNLLGGEKDSLPLLSFYDEHQKKFAIDNKSEIINTIDLRGGNFDIAFNPKGILWIMKDGDGIYQYELASGNLKKMATLEDGWVRGTRVGRDGEINFILTKSVLTEDNNGIYLQDSQINVYFPDKNEFLSFPIPREGLTEGNSVPLAYNFDEDGRLWIENRVYRDIDGQWYKIISNPNFITDNWNERILIEESFDADRQYNLDSFYSISSTSDGNMWFIGEEGTFRANANNGSWCWVSTEKSIVLEDGIGNLWMLAGESLYKRPLDELGN